MVMEVAEVPFSVDGLDVSVGLTPGSYGLIIVLSLADNDVRSDNVAYGLEHLLQFEFDGVLLLKLLSDLGVKFFGLSA